eukprot:14947285-Ditylum_brightwellii.AAC.1
MWKVCLDYLVAFLSRHVVDHVLHVNGHKNTGHHDSLLKLFKRADEIVSFANMLRSPLATIVIIALLGNVSGLMA